MITREEVVRVLHYDECTGIFTWKISHANNVKAGRETGCVNVSVSGKAYRVIRINGRSYKAHRLAWLILTGNFPDDQIDHIDGNGLNNRSVNLRAVSRAENCKNVRKHARNTSGVTGVYWDKAGSKWYASIKINGKQKRLGYFDFDEAVAVRKEAERIHGFHHRHGETRPL